MSLSIGSVAVLATATPCVGLQASGPGSLVLTVSGAGAVTIGGANVTAGGAGPGQATIPPNSVVPLAALGNLGPGPLYAIAAATGSTLSWFVGTNVS